MNYMRYLFAGRFYFQFQNETYFLLIYLNQQKKILGGADEILWYRMKHLLASIVASYYMDDMSLLMFYFRLFLCLIKCHDFAVFIQ